MDESEDLQLNANNKLYYTNTSTQTKFSKKKEAIRFKYKHSPQQQTNTKQCCEENKINKNEVLEQNTNIKNENTNIDGNNLDSIENCVDRKVNDITNGNIENNIRCISLDTQMQQLISNKSIEKQMHLDTEFTPRIQEYEDLKSTTTTTTTTTTFPRIKFQPKRHNRNRITNAIKDLSKSSAFFKINVKVSSNINVFPTRV